MQAEDLIRERNVNNSLQLLLADMTTAPCFQGGPFLTGTTVVSIQLCHYHPGPILPHTHPITAT